MWSKFVFDDHEVVLLKGNEPKKVLEHEEVPGTCSFFCCSPNLRKKNVRRDEILDLFDESAPPRGWSTSDLQSFFGVVTTIDERIDSRKKDKLFSTSTSLAHSQIESAPSKCPSCSDLHKTGYDDTLSTNPPSCSTSHSSQIKKKKK
eukprot:GHVL01035338.1.p2 GENE.GHVL01035338.1~~GHVL01035338.1.p2  ORF type:complete len:147 (-),score=27.79 GHVL01035338.1:58-498(-)